MYQDYITMSKLSWNNVLYCGLIVYFVVVVVAVPEVLAALRPRNDGAHRGLAPRNEHEHDSRIRLHDPGVAVLVAIRAGGEGDVTDTHVVWERTKGIPYVASPLLYGGRLYYVKKGGYVSSVDATSGEPCA